MAITYTQYAGDGTTTRFAVPFGFARPTDLIVYVGGISVPFDIDNEFVVLDSAPASLAVVLIQRVTNISAPLVVFSNTGALYAEQVNSQFDQVRYRIEELNSIITGSGITAPGGTSGNVPNPTGTSQFIASTPSGGGFVWSLQSIAQMQTLLGINTGGTTDSRLPAPNTANTFLTVNVSGNAYQLSSVATVKTLLGVPTVNLPDIAGRANHILVTNGSATAYDLSDAASVRSLLGLGSAAQLNAGTSVGNLVQLVSGGAGAALPAVSGVNLTGVAREPETFIAEKLTNTAVSTSSFGQFAVMSSGLSAVGTPPSWATVAATGITLQPGKYRVSARFLSGGTPAASGFVGGRINTSGGTVTGAVPILGLIDVNSTDTDDYIETQINVTVATELRLEIGGQAAGVHNVQRQRLVITRVANA